jgi:hypothetical protein
MHRLLRNKPMKGFIQMNGLLFSYLTFWTTFATLVRFFQIFWKNPFEIFSK